MNKKEIMVTKRNGEKEPLDIEKIHKVLNFACEGLSNVSVSAIAVNAHLNFYNGIKTTDIHDVLIRTAANMVTEETPNYQYVAGRLTNLKLRKDVYGKWEPDTLYNIIVRNVNDGWYDKEILEKYTKEEIDYFDKQINHDNDQLFTYAAWKQLLSKYLVQNRVTGEYKETPQIMYMLIPMTMFANYKGDERKKLVVDFYKATSKAHKSTIGLPTPILGGVRTPTRQFSSCVVGKCGDSLDSITASTDAIVHYVSKRAGIGWDISRIRPLGSPIRNGEAYHTGALPFIKLLQAATHSCSQGGIRSGSSTVYYPIWHMEIENLLVLKNNKGTEDNRARHLDYGVQINEHFYVKAYNKEDYYLFDQNQVPDLYDAFFEDDEKFAELYEKYSKKRNIRKKKVNAFELLCDLVNERSETGRIYIFNTDNVNKHKPMKSTVYSSNLCVAGDTMIYVKIKSLHSKVLSSAIKYRMDEFIEEYENNKDSFVYYIKSFNIETGIVEWKEVIDGAKTGYDQEVIEVVDNETGKKLVCTPDHEVYTVNRGYVKASDLMSDDILIFD